ncbi:hypothetical protein EJ05DRAFT_477360 [Pseudovirgaria hyperparasitica]|uniref:Uncharacterized protein n=1 Tax=Pseudovirgaria hyperparasitica TaxID=470096 RepID=A0A6A6W7T6_9PEZI|nr:uncharacterized protein EJ05DRAFT_477360 [Pseudovirgaria hyperparasitica]KAF2757141.1 hypothetical protein EJ05DRAFT_477360 [Pseudovirgaria hyperparasitica]
MKTLASVLYTLAFIPLLATVTHAQDDLPDLNTVPNATGRAESTAAPESTQPPSSSAEPTSQPPSPADTGAFHLTGLPTIAGALNPTVGVPYTADAPYMQKSSLPEGTVFICVGAALGFLGACILAWRGAVAWSLHRSAKRAAAVNYPGEKINLRGPSGGVYSGVAASSTLTLDKPNVLAKKHLSAAPSNISNGKRATSSLFFSPTAGPGHQSQNRSSSYLPAGYYAPGNSTPTGSSANLGQGPSSLSLNPSAAGYNRARSTGPSPPGSPALPSRDGYPRAARGRDFDSFSRSSVVNTGDRSRSVYAGRPSTSSLNLSVAPEGRAPSAYLEDLFENHGSGPRERH